MSRVFSWMFPAILGALLGLSGSFFYRQWHSRQEQIAVVQNRYTQLSAEAEEAEDIPTITPEQRLEKLRKDQQEMERLREELARLKSEQSSLVAQSSSIVQEQQKTREERSRTRTPNLPPPATPVVPTPDELEAAHRADMQTLQVVGRLLLQFTKQQDGALPGNLAQLRELAPGLIDPSDLQRFELLSSGNLNDFVNPDQTPVVRSRSRDPLGRRIYLFADGHVHVQKESK